MTDVGCDRTDSVGWAIADPGQAMTDSAGHAGRAGADGAGCAGTTAGLQRAADELLAYGFHHREHVQVAWLSVCHLGRAESAVLWFTGWLRRLTAAAGQPAKYHHTMSRAWVELVAHHAGQPPDADFDAFTARCPDLLDKRLLDHHYSPAVLASAEARGGWVEPDLRPFPWAAGVS